jgi:hypothetical protein
VPFTPANISGLSLWVKSDAGVYTDAGVTLATNGQTVRQWNDQSGNGNHLSQATSSQRPTYVTNVVNGMPELQSVAANSQLLFTNTNFPTPFTVFLVARKTALTNGRLLAGRNNDWLLGWWHTLARQAFWTNTVLLGGSVGEDPNRWWLYTGTYDGTTANVWENGTLFASVAGSFAGPNGLEVGGAQNTNGEPSDSGILEVAIYNRVLTTQERQNVDTYLAKRWLLFPTFNHGTKSRPR